MKMMRTRPFIRYAAAALVCAAAFVGRPGDAEAVIVERIVAVIGERAFLLSELRERARPYLFQAQQRVPEGAQRAAAESQILKELIEKMVTEELEAQAAVKAKVSVTSEEIDNAIQNIAASSGIEPSDLYKEARERSGLSTQEYRDELRRQILEGKMLQLRVKGRVRITEEDLKAQFERSVREERRRREYRPAWVVLRILPGSSREAIEERKALASEIAARAARGEDFTALAAKYSDDPDTRDKGGDLGIRAPQGSPNALSGKRGVMSADLEAALLPLEPGQIAGPIEAGDAVVVLKLIERQASRYTTFEDARNEMIQRLQADILDKAKRKWLDELRRRTHVDVRL